MFDFAKSYPVAMATLKEDPRLQKLRFELVPKKYFCSESLTVTLFIDLFHGRISEEKFWHNYFYRVFLIKQSSQLASLASGKRPFALSWYVLVII